MQYSHTLIPMDRHFVPVATQIEAFLCSMAARGVIPGTTNAVLRTPSDRTREI